MEYLCNKCDKKYSSYQSLWIHNKKFHSSDGSKVGTTGGNNSGNKVTFKIYICNICSKEYNNKYSKYKHQKICTNANQKTNEIKELKIEIKQEIDKLKDENIKLKKLIGKKANKKVVNNNSGTIVNGNVTNNIVINKIGQENLLELNNKEITEIFNKELEGVLTFIELLNFNERLPSNHSFCTTSLESKYLSTYNTDTNKVDKDRKKYFFDKLLNISIEKMEKLFTLNKTKFNNKKQKQIQDNIMNLKSLRNYDFNNKLIKEISNKMNLISYNKRDVVQKTWNKNDSDSEDDFQKDLDKPPTEEESEDTPIIKKNNIMLKKLPSDSEDDNYTIKYESSSDDESTISMDINKEIFLDIYKNCEM